MNSEKYLTELSGYLNPLSKEEKRNAMEYYREYVADIEANGEDIVEKLGTPKDLANSILSDNAVKNLSNPDTEVKHKMHGCLIAVLVLFALPIGLPLAIAAFALVIAFGATGVGLFVGAIGAVIAGFTFLFVIPMTGITFLGMSLVLVGVSILAVLAAIGLCKFVFMIIGFIFGKAAGKGEVQ